MGERTGEQASAAVEYGYKQKTYRNRENDLTQITYQVRTVAVERVYQMSDAKGCA